MNYIKSLYQGRVGRMNYFLASLTYGLINIIVFVVIKGISYGPVSNSINHTASILNIILIVAVAIFGFGITVRRCHDLNYSGFLSLITLIPLVGMIFSLYLLFAPGTEGANNYGSPSTDNFINATFNPGRGNGANAEQNPGQNAEQNQGQSTEQNPAQSSWQNAGQNTGNSGGANPSQTV